MPQLRTSETISVGGGVVGNLRVQNTPFPSINCVGGTCSQWWPGRLWKTAGVAGRTCKFESREARTTAAVGVVGRWGVVRRKTTNQMVHVAVTTPILLIPYTDLFPSGEKVHAHPTE